jgi:hypothetical protein
VTKKLIRIECDEEVEIEGASIATVTNGATAEKEAIKDANAGAMAECARASRYRCPQSDCTAMMVTITLGKPVVTRKNIYAANDPQEVVGQKVRAVVDWMLVITCEDPDKIGGHSARKKEGNNDALDCTLYGHVIGHGIAVTGHGDDDRSAREDARRQAEKTASGNALADFEKHEWACSKDCPDLRFRLLITPTLDPVQKDAPNKYSCEALCKWEYWVDCVKEED